jgi:hypothetical protein
MDVEFMRRGASSIASRALRGQALVSSGLHAVWAVEPEPIPKYQCGFRVARARMPAVLRERPSGDRWSAISPRLSWPWLLAGVPHQQGHDGRRHFFGCFQVIFGRWSATIPPGK